MNTFFRPQQHIWFCDLEDVYSGKSLSNTQVDPNVLKQWLEVCVAEDEPECELSSERKDELHKLLPKIRCIDVIEKCIVSIPSTRRYVALSYVWGTATIPRLEKNKIVEFETPGSLAPILPRSFSDAMLLMNGLGERYLWIDTLCLVQDDPEDLQKGVENMDVIYELAHFTIVNAAGKNANASISRLKNPSSLNDEIVQEIFPGLKFMSSPEEVERHLSKSTWTSRGWTLQEQFLSRRLFILINNRVYFRCHVRMFAEDRRGSTSYQVMSSTLSSMLKHSAAGNFSPLLIFNFMNELASNYLSRQLSYEDDKVKAVAGLLNRVCRSVGTKPLCGLPGILFPAGLLFERGITDVTPVFTIATSDPEQGKRRPKFPSWTWAGWRFHPSWRFFLRSPFSKIEEVPVRKLLAKTTWIHWLCLLEGELHTLFSWTADNDDIIAHEIKPYLNRYQRQDNFDTSQITNPPYPLLIFETLTINLKSKNEWVYEHVAFVKLIDGSGGLCGLLRPDVEEDSHARTVTLAVLDEGFPNELDSILRRPEDTEEWLSFWVLQIEWTGTFYERRGVGRIRKDTLKNLPDEEFRWQQIILG